MQLLSFAFQILHPSQFNYHHSCFTAHYSLEAQTGEGDGEGLGVFNFSNCKKMLYCTWRQLRLQPVQPIQTCF